MDKFGKTFNTPPLTLRMIVVPEGVKVGLYRMEKVVSYADVMATQGLPSPLIRFLQAMDKPQEHIYHLAWPDAKALYDELKAAPSDRLILEAEDIEALTRIERPANFRLHWVYNAAQIDQAKVIWAHDLDPATNARLLAYYSGRRVWRLDADANPRYPVELAQFR